MTRERTARTISWSIGLLALLLVTVLASAAMGPVKIHPVEVAKILLNALALPTLADGPAQVAELSRSGFPFPTFESWSPFHFPVDRTHETIVLRVRLPRIALAGVVGFALAAAGTVMQGFFRNPMADPSIIGVSSGAALGAVAVIALPLALPVPVAAFIGALVAAFAVYLIATQDGHTPIATLLLAGIAIQTLLGAAISFLLINSGQSMAKALFWLMGHLHLSEWTQVAIVAAVAIPGTVLLYAYARDLNLLLLGEVDARTLGVNVESTKRRLLAVSSLVTAVAVAFTGVIGFVGLIVPHIMRLVVGPYHRVLLPTGALAGAVFLVATDTIARAGASELPVGIVTAAIGAPFFLYLLRRKEVRAL